MKEAYLNDLETELWLLFANHDEIQNLRFRTGACYGDVSEDARVKINFLPAEKPGVYDGLRIDATSRSMGRLGSFNILFRDFMKSWSYLQLHGEKVNWIPERPAPRDYAAVRSRTFAILEALREPLPEIPQSALKQKKSAKSRDQTR